MLKQQPQDAAARPLLSILVPTWNREKDLRQLLAMLVPLAAATPRVELIISNNGSTDGTRDFLDALPSQPRLRIIHQPINYGMSLHLAWLYGQARGKYLWLFSDDDLFEPELLGEILACLDNHPELAWIHLPHQFMNPNAPTLSLCPRTPIFTKRGRNIFGDYFRWITFISSNVIRTDQLQPRLPKLTFPSLYWPASLLMATVADLPGCVFAERKINAGPDISWADQQIEVNCLHLPETVLASPVLSRAEKRACLRGHYRVIPEALDSLVWLRPSLFIRLLALDPTQCNPARFIRIFRRAIAILMYGRKRPAAASRSGQGPTS